MWEDFLGVVSKVSQAALPARSHVARPVGASGPLQRIHSAQVPPGTCPIRVAIFFAHLDAWDS